ncbi:MAG TPA: hypothetical protein VFR61_03180 [Nitrososphaeraceae archaeon]|nr:hypothetical protein [Nitrososphaeraceae archaeon]
MAENEDENIIKKAEEEKRDIEAGEEIPPIKDPEEKRDIEAREEIPPIKDPEENLREAEQNLREEAGKIVDENEKSGDSMPSMPSKNIEEHEPTRVDRDHYAPEKVKKRIGGTTIPGILARKPILMILIIGAIVLGAFLVYSQIQLSNQSYKVENYNALWNQSLADLRGGNTSIAEYCNSPVHDEDLCNKFMNLQYMG